MAALGRVRAIVTVFHTASRLHNNHIHSPYSTSTILGGYKVAKSVAGDAITRNERGMVPLPYSGLVQRCQIRLNATLTSRHCWQCHSELSTNTEFCLGCKSLQPPDHQRDHFETLGIQRSFRIDVKILTTTFRMLQAQFHPDRYSLKSEREQQFAHDHSSAVNKAYQCLQHPVERALYFLDQAGQPLQEGQIDLDPMFLAEIMEVNEELMEAEDKETVQAIGHRSMQILNNLLSEADAAFSRNDIEKARTVVAKIKYYNNIYEKVKSFEREHGIVD